MFRSMLLAGTDINGDTDGQFRYVAIVIGTETAVNELFDKIGLRTVEMKKLKKPQRKHVKKNMDFSGHEFLAMCLKVDRQKLIKYFTTHTHSKAKFTGKKEVHRYFDTALLSLLKNWIDGFCQHHGSRFEQLNFQCDPDMSKTINNWNLLSSREGRAYEFADAISYCYEHKWTPVKGCKYENYSDKIKIQLTKYFMK